MLLNHTQLSFAIPITFQVVANNLIVMLKKDMKLYFNTCLIRKLRDKVQIKFDVRCNGSYIAH